MKICKLESCKTSQCGDYEQIQVKLYTVLPCKSRLETLHFTQMTLTFGYFGGNGFVIYFLREDFNILGLSLKSDSSGGGF